MAFQLASIDPTSVPINLLNPRPGTKFGDRDYMDPWEAVKWIAIFRLIIPGALFRLCGGRVENLGELQGLAVKAGLNGVMMGNFLTTLGSTPEEDRELFTELGLNVAPQADNGANPRPDNRSGWLEGETPDVVADHLEAIEEEPARGARRARHQAVGPVDAAALPPQDARAAASRRRAEPVPLGRGMSRVEERLAELSSRGLRRRTRLIEGPQGPRVTVDGREALLLCSNNYLGLAEHPRVREAAAEAALRWGAGAGASRLVSGSMEVHEDLERRLADFEGAERALLFGSGYLANAGVVSALAGRGDVVCSDELNHASIVDGCRLSRAEVFVYRHNDVEHLAWGLERAAGRAALVVTDSVFSMDGDVAPLAELVEAAHAHGARLVVDEAHGTGALGPGGRGAVAEAGLDGRGRRRRRHARQGARRLRGVRLRRRRDDRAAGQRRAAVHLLHRAAAAVGGRGAGRARGPGRRPRPAAAPAGRRRRAARRARGRGLARQRLAHPDRPARRRRRRRRDAAVRGRARARRVRPGDPPADRPRGDLAAAPGRDGHAARRRARRRGAGDHRRRARPRAGPAGRPGRVSGLFVTGTDTGAGKSVVTAALAAALGARGLRVAARKPVLTGVDEPPAGPWPMDDRVLALATGEDPRAVAPLRFGPPVSPHLAAELSGTTLTAAGLAAHCAAGDADAVVVEGVGGLLVPLGPDETVRDLALALGLPVVIAARPGLGTINHTLLTLEAARAAGLTVAAVVLTPWPEEPDTIEASNRATLAARAGVGVHVLPRVAPVSREALAAAAADLPVEDWLSAA